VVPGPDGGRGPDQGQPAVGVGKGPGVERTGDVVEPRRVGHRDRLVDRAELGTGVGPDRRVERVARDEGGGDDRRPERRPGHDHHGFEWPPGDVAERHAAQVPPSEADHRSAASPP
jgi:hypothetical protein